MIASLLVVALAAVGQPSPGPRVQPTALDPFLWPELEAAVAAAAAAEHDPKRGPGNAIEILEAEKRRHGSTRARSALDLRIAGIGLRQAFLTSTRFPPPMRHAQALSTYSRLDVVDPGLKPTLAGALAARRDALRAGGEKAPPAELKVAAAVLPRTRSFDKAAFEGALRRALEGTGARLALVPVKSAGYVLAVGAREVPSGASTERTIVVELELEAVADGQPTWRHSIFRSAVAASAEAALAEGTAWVARIGARDLLFHYLSEGPLPDLQALDPRRAQREHLEHGPGGHADHRH